MTKTCPSCYSCGMPLKQAADFACGDTKNKYCSHCTDEKGKLKPYQKIVEGTANYLVHSQGLNQSAALEIAENMISKQPEWQKRR